ncbi:MAG: helix-turn-helix transcriptional regulator [Verrucomicrobiales bacterium]|nr:helix-turn-helix transcriptional regulator [Verrucomicrobiales bacterium]
MQSSTMTTTAIMAKVPGPPFFGSAHSSQISPTFFNITVLSVREGRPAFDPKVCFIAQARCLYDSATLNRCSETGTDSGRFSLLLEGPPVCNGLNIPCISDSIAAMQLPTTILTPEGWLDGALVKQFRRALRKSQQDFAAAAHLTRGAISKIEREKPKERLAHTVDLLVKFLEANKTKPPNSATNPIRRSLSELIAYLKEDWWSYHWTRDGQGQPMSMRSRWHIDAQANCTITHEGTGLRYHGRVQFEGDERVVVTVQAENQLDEQVVWRFDRPIKETNQIVGGWFGVDYGRKICSGSFCLSRRKFDTRAAEQFLATLAPFEVLPTKPAPQLFSMLDAWDDAQVRAAIESSADGETISALSTYFPQIRLEDAIELRAERAARESKGKSISLKKQVSFRICLLDPALSEVLAVRAAHLNKEVSADYIKEQILTQLSIFTELSKKYRKFARIEVRLFRAWPMATFFQIGNHALYFGLILAHKPAFKGPMFILRNPDSRAWRKLSDDFQVVFDNATPPPE